MPDVVIRCENLSKLYRIGEKRERYRTLRDSITTAFTAPFKKFRKKDAADSKEKSTIWALKDVSFEVKRGEILGVIGRNGAGKSTLLKILSRITDPTKGFAEIRGRVNSLLEVGTGFHPELTGRENIFLNAAILGMKRQEILKKFDEIVTFAEVEEFIDTPVKFYSSGMSVRLAFSVAAHLQPEVLLVDEVLAVGDAAFQKKCFGKMDEVAEGGRTILLVSHQMNQIRRLCDQCIWFEAGGLRKIGATPDVANAYEIAMSSTSFDKTHSQNERGTAARFISWEIIEPRSEPSNILATTGPATLRFTLEVNQPIHHGTHGIALFKTDGQLMWGAAENHLTLNTGTREFVYTLPSLPLQPGVYYWLVSLYDDKGLVDVWHCTPEMSIETKPVTHPVDRWQGLLNLPWKFQIR